MQERWLSVEGIGAHLSVNPHRVCKWLTCKKKPGQELGRLSSSYASKVHANLNVANAAECAASASGVDAFFWIPLASLALSR